MTDIIIELRLNYYKFFNKQCFTNYLVPGPINTRSQIEIETFTSFFGDEESASMQLIDGFKSPLKMLQFYGIFGNFNGVYKYYSMVSYTFSSPILCKGI